MPAWAAWPWTQTFNGEASEANADAGQSTNLPKL